MMVSCVHRHLMHRLEASVCGHQVSGQHLLGHRNVLGQSPYFHLANIRPEPDVRSPGRLRDGLEMGAILANHRPNLVREHRVDAHKDGRDARVQTGGRVH